MSAAVDLTKLRESFPPEQVGKLPRITCGECSRASGRCCAKHEKRKCAECDNFITDRHMHLDYVGHGAVTDRLLEVDPEWNWDPCGEDHAGQPIFVVAADLTPIGLWIKLTVGGVTRRGFGSCPPGQFDAEKVLIGDALRNAAMRFGVALDLWIKGHAEDDERSTATDTRTGATRASKDAEPTALAKDELTAKDAKGQLLAHIEGDKDAATAAWTAAGLDGRWKVTAAELAQAVAAFDNPPATPGDEVEATPPVSAPDPEEPGAYSQHQAEAVRIADEAPEVAS